MARALRRGSCAPPHASPSPAAARSRLAAFARALLLGVRVALAEAEDDFEAVAVPVAVPLPAPLAVGAAGVWVAAPPVGDRVSEAVLEGDTETLAEREPLLLPRAVGEAVGQKEVEAVAEGEVGKLK